ncbi:PAS domain-containing protein [Mycoplana dimorpha]|uniref:PAS domain-containing protein n=1 Tax=Mycoplana dimorpha TaxID=28320 RepID=A0A2T5B7R0_MYCDI|nr:PAS domain-containing protein [Mycoplana dimorpha]PTM94963.1 hypothetical protein C7449_10426 [Mycoplana dimorpha]
MQTTTTRAIHAYWSGVRGARDVPDRRDIEPAALRQYLPDLFILEQVSGSAPLFRLAGTRLCALFGRELRATAFDRLFAAEVRDRIGRICGAVAAQRRAAVLLASACGQSSRLAAVEILLLPITSQSSHADRIFGALVPLEPVPPLALPLRPMTQVSFESVAPQQEFEPCPEPSPAALPATVIRVGARDFGQRLRRMLNLRVFDGGK